MDLQQLEILEEKVGQAVQFIERLKRENQALQKEIDELRSESQSNEQLIKQLKEENHNLKLVQNESSLGKEKEEQIKSKVEQMLSKLEELQYL
ncbi:MAG: hypothetical protein ACE5IY_09510 [bacterium]